MKQNILLIIIAAGLFAFASCEKKQDETVIGDKATFSAEINGQVVSLIESDSIVDIASYVSFGSSLLRKSHEYDYTINIMSLDLGGLIFASSSTKKRVSINIVNHLMNSEYDENGDLPATLLESILATGKREYTFNSDEAQGVYIEWYDTEGMFWTSEFSKYNIDDTNASNTNQFSIVRSFYQEELSDENNTYQYLELSFECTLYNHLGQSILLKNGMFKGDYTLHKHSM